MNNTLGIGHHVSCISDQNCVSSPITSVNNIYLTFLHNLIVCKVLPHVLLHLIHDLLCMEKRRELSLSPCRNQSSEIKHIQIVMSRTEVKVIVL